MVKKLLCLCLFGLLALLGAQNPGPSVTGAIAASGGGGGCPYTDNFSGSGNVNPSVWAAFTISGSPPDGGVPIQVSGKATGASTSMQYGAYVLGTVCSFNPAAETNQGALYRVNQSSGICVDMTGGGNGVCTNIGAGNYIYVYTLTGGSFSYVTGNGPISSGDTIHLYNTGTTYTVVDVTTSTTLVTTTISGYDTAGTPGIYINEGTLYNEAVGPVTFD